MQILSYSQFLYTLNHTDFDTCFENREILRENHAWLVYIVYLFKWKKYLLLSLLLHNNYSMQQVELLQK